MKMKGFLKKLVSNYDIINSVFNCLFNFMKKIFF